MSNNQKRIQLTLALLVGMFILGGTLLNIAIGEDEVYNLDVNGDGDIDVVVTLTTEIDINENIHPDANPEDLSTFSAPSPSYSIASMSGSVSVSGTRIDDEGNEIGSVSVIGGVGFSLVNFNVISNYWAYASSCVSLGDYVGMADAWVEVPGNSRVNHAYGPGDFWVSGNHYIDACANAADSNTITETINEFLANFGNKSMAAYAMLSMEGARIEVKFTAEGQ